MYETFATSETARTINRHLSTLDKNLRPNPIRLTRTVL